MFCIRLALPVGFIVVRPPPAFTYTTSPSLVVTPSIGDVIRFLSLPVITQSPSAFTARSCFKSPNAGIDPATLASAGLTSSLPEDPTDPDM